MRRIGESIRLQEALGCSKDDLNRITLYDVVAADRSSTVTCGGPSSRPRLVGAEKISRKDGTLLDVEANGSIIVRDGSTTGLCRERITERARAEDLLEERVAKALWYCC